MDGKLDEYVTGFFTDEPNTCDFFCNFSEGSVWLPWSDGFEQFFEERRGYDIREKLDGLFFQMEGCEKVRHDYCLTIDERFGESYFKQIHDWLAARNLKFAGYLIFENDTGYAARTSGAIMPFYEYIDIPGIDILGEQDQEFLTVEQCISVWEKSIHCLRSTDAPSGKLDLKDRSGKLMVLPLKIQKEQCLQGIMYR